MLQFSESDVTVSEDMYDAKTDLKRSKFLPSKDQTEERIQRLELTIEKLASALSDLVQRTNGPWMRATQLPELFGSWDLAYRCTKSGWLKPIVQGKRRTIYRLADVLACLQRIEAGELPPPRPSRKAE